MVKKTLIKVLTSAPLVLSIPGYANRLCGSHVGSGSVEVGTPHRRGPRH